MNGWKVSTIALSVALGAVIGTSAVHPASAEPQPRMEDALAKLQDAKGWLERAADDKGGHKGKAIGYVNQAIDETHAGIKWANEHH